MGERHYMPSGFCNGNNQRADRPRETLEVLIGHAKAFNELCFIFSFQIIKALRFCHIEKTDHVPSAHAVRLVLPISTKEVSAMQLVDPKHKT